MLDLMKTVRIPELDGRSSEAQRHATNYGTGYWSDLGAICATATILGNMAEIARVEEGEDFSVYDEFLDIMKLRLGNTGSSIPDDIRSMGQMPGVHRLFTFTPAGLTRGAMVQIEEEIHSKMQLFNAVANLESLPYMGYTRTHVGPWDSFEFNLEWDTLIGEMADHELIMLFRLLGAFMGGLGWALEMINLRDSGPIGRLRKPVNRRGLYIVGYDNLMDLTKERVIMAGRIEDEQEIVDILTEWDDESNPRFEYKSWFWIP